MQKGRKQEIELQNLEYSAFMVRVERVKNTEIYFNEEFYKRILKVECI